MNATTGREKKIIKKPQTFLSPYNQSKNTQSKKIEYSGSSGLISAMHREGVYIFSTTYSLRCTPKHQITS